MFPNYSLQCIQKRHQVGSLLVRENKTKVILVVADHALERRRDAVVKVRRTRREGAERRRLEPAEVAPKPGDLTAACVRQLADLACRSVAESVERQIRSARLCRRGADVEQRRC